MSSDNEFIHLLAFTLFIFPTPLFLLLVGEFCCVPLVRKQITRARIREEN